MYKMENKIDEFKDLELIYTESKWENTIDRLTSRARTLVKQKGFQLEQNLTLIWFLMYLMKKILIDFFYIIICYGYGRR